METTVASEMADILGGRGVQSVMHVIVYAHHTHSIYKIIFMIGHTYNTFALFNMQLTHRVTGWEGAYPRNSIWLLVLIIR